MPSGRVIVTAVLTAAIASAAAAAPAEPLPRGDAAVGRALFIGARALEKGGPPCGACHAVGGASAPFSAALGPELTTSFQGMPAEALDGMLQDLPFPTMTPLYAAAPLTAPERAHLAAFFEEATGKPAPGAGAVAVWAAAIAAACLLAMRFGAARRIKGSTRADLMALARRRAAAPPPARALPLREPAREPPATSPRRAHGGSR